MSDVRFEPSADPVPLDAFPLVRERLWSGAGSNRRPSAFQVNRAKRCADLRKRTSLTSGTALGGRCNVHANRVRYAMSTRQTAPNPSHVQRVGVEDRTEAFAHVFDSTLLDFALDAAGRAR